MPRLAMGAAARCHVRHEALLPWKPICQARPLKQGGQAETWTFVTDGSGKGMVAALCDTLGHDHSRSRLHRCYVLLLAPETGCGTCGVH